MNRITSLCMTCIIMLGPSNHCISAEEGAEVSAAISARPAGPILVEQGADGQYRSPPGTYSVAYDALAEALKAPPESASEGGAATSAAGGSAGGLVRVLELGFGTIDTSAALSAMKTAGRPVHVTLVDLNKENVIATCAAIAGTDLEGSVDLILGRVPDVFMASPPEIEDGRYDVVYASFLLHFLDPEHYIAALVGIIKALKPGGKFIYVGRSPEDDMLLITEYRRLASMMPRWVAENPREVMIARANAPGNTWGGYFFDPTLHIYRKFAEGMGASMFCDISSGNLAALCARLGFKPSLVTDTTTPELMVRRRGAPDLITRKTYTVGVFDKSGTYESGLPEVLEELRAHQAECDAAEADDALVGRIQSVMEGAIKAEREAAIRALLSARAAPAATRSGAATGGAGRAAVSAVPSPEAEGDKAAAGKPAQPKPKKGKKKKARKKKK